MKVLIRGIFGISTLSLKGICGFAPQRLSMIQCANGNHVHIRDNDILDQKLNRFIQGGVSKLQVITDFDFTLSKFAEEGERCAGSHGVLTYSDILSQEFHRTSQELFDKYYPIEIDPGMEREEKCRLMVEWWTMAHDNIIQRSGLTVPKIKEAVQGAKIALRGGLDKLFDLVDQHHIPLLIFSAGLGDVLEEVLHQRLPASAPRPLPAHVHIVSNRMEFAPDGQVVRFRDPLFHVFNKNAGAILDQPYFTEEHMQERCNVLLLGDSTGDVHMADGLPFEPNVIRVGFLNDKVEERLENYKNIYDIVITGDGDLQIPTEIVCQAVSGGNHV